MHHRNAPTQTAGRTISHEIVVVSAYNSPWTFIVLLSLVCNPILVLCCARVTPYECQQCLESAIANPSIQTYEIRRKTTVNMTLNWPPRSCNPAKRFPIMKPEREPLSPALEIMTLHTMRVSLPRKHRPRSVCEKPWNLVEGNPIILGSEPSNPLNPWMQSQRAKPDSSSCNPIPASRHGYCSAHVSNWKYNAQDCLQTNTVKSTRPGARRRQCPHEITDARIPHTRDEKSFDRRKPNACNLKVNNPHSNAILRT